MERLTNGLLRRIVDEPHAKLCFDKLSKIEDIEEELGIDMVTLFKALKNGFFYKDNSKIKHTDRDIVVQRYAEKLEIASKFHFDGFLDEYGKTWALTKEELEK